MFDEFSTVDTKNEFEIVENGFVLRVSGRNHNENWINKSYIFNSDEQFFAAINKLSEKEAE